MKICRWGCKAVPEWDSTTHDFMTLDQPLRVVNHCGYKEPLASRTPWRASTNPGWASAQIKDKWGRAQVRSHILLKYFHETVSARQSSQAVVPLLCSLRWPPVIGKREMGTDILYIYSLIYTTNWAPGYDFLPELCGFNGVEGSVITFPGWRVLMSCLKQSFTTHPGTTALSSPHSSGHCHSTEWRA